MKSLSVRHKTVGAHRKIKSAVVVIVVVAKAAAGGGKIQESPQGLGKQKSCTEFNI